MFALFVVVVGDCAGGGVPLGAVPALSWCGEASLGDYISANTFCVCVYAAAPFSSPPAARTNDETLLRPFKYKLLTPPSHLERRTPHHL